ncbi:glycosyltransferase [Tieghemostelium lacteum]|uniref:Fucosyltransferase n=1 Tax=Tieghemostelium lacteum TaxID=361077 RepID=A0A151ZGS4_TIELA|nr:glycosyltransferase [Tieghemostelium lacteum]|eukprot:KYQ93109.1 glycosyltransferase [Tieghemostelium lacteum]
MTLIIIINYNTTLNLYTKNAEEKNNKHPTRNDNRDYNNDKNSAEVVNPIDREGDTPDESDPRVKPQQNGNNNNNNNNKNFNDFDDDQDDFSSNGDSDDFEINKYINNNNNLDESDESIEFQVKPTPSVDNKEMIKDQSKITVNLEKSISNWNRWDLESLKKSEPVEHCHYSNHRDYNESPVHVVVENRQSPAELENCDIPCRASDSKYIDASVYSRDECTKSIYTTLENVPPHMKFDIVSTTSMKSDVPIGYYSWREYPYYRKPKDKVYDDNQGLVAAFISNCGPHKRLDWIERLQKAGVRVDSYGKCLHNKDIPKDRNGLPSDYNGEKMEIASTYKFTMAFENANTDDYVTEKLFGILTVGSVPLYDGAANGRDFFPTPDAGILANDFNSPEDMAKHLLYLNSNDTAYREYLRWKTTGPTKDWMSLIDNSLYSRECRTCIKTADLHRKVVGRVLPSNSTHLETLINVPKTFTKEDGIVVYVREKSKFWFHALQVPFGTTYQQLKEIFSKNIPHNGDLYQAYDYWSKDLIISDKLHSNQIINLKQEQEIEVQFVDLNFFWDSFNTINKIK